MASPSLNVVGVSEETEMDDQPKAVGNDTLIVKVDDELVRKISNADLQATGSRELIVDVSNLFAACYDNLKNGFSGEELIEFTRKVSQISTRFQNHPELKGQLNEWLESRKELIKTSKSAAEMLDKIFIAVNWARMFGSVFEISNSLNLYQTFCSSIALYVSNISPKLGLLTKSALELASHLRFMGFVSSVLENQVSQANIKHVVKVMKKDKDKFMPLKEWFDETNEIKDSVKKLFPYGISEEIIQSIEKAVKDLGQEEKIFTGIVLSSIKKEPKIYKDGIFLAKAFLFCRSDAAKEWYNRILIGAPPSDLKQSMDDMKEALQKLEGTVIDSGLALEVSKFFLPQLEKVTESKESTIGQLEKVTESKESTIGRLMRCSISCMSVYYCYENMKSGSTHRYSDRLRELSSNAQSFMNEIEKCVF